MIVKGEFDAVSLAIYGEVVTEALATPSTYTPQPLPSITPAGLPPALDPANTRDPTQLARQLLKLIPNAPDLELVIRLIFCLKPSNEDWDLPDFPYLHPDLDDLDADAELEKVVKLTTRPVPDDISSEHLARFTEKIAQCVDPKVNLDVHCVDIGSIWAIAGQGSQPGVPRCQHSL